MKNSLICIIALNLLAKLTVAAIRSLILRRNMQFEKGIHCNNEYLRVYVVK